MPRISCLSWASGRNRDVEAVVWFDASPTWAVAVGAAAGMAAETRLMVAPLLLSALLVGSAGLDTAPAAVLAAAAAWTVVAALDRRTDPGHAAEPGTVPA